MRLPTSIQTQLSEKRRDSIAIGIALLLAASLRIINLLSQKAFWDDELFSVLLARKPFWDVLYGAIIDVHPPGHLLFLHAFYSMFGDADWAYRLPSVLSGCALIIVVYFLGREFFDKTSALLASFLVSISPFFIQLSNEARSYSLATLAITFMSYSLIKSFRTSETNWYRAYTISAILCAYIDHFAWIWLFMVNLFLLLKGKFREFLPSHLRIFLYGVPALWLTIHQTLFSTEKLAPHVQRSFIYIPTVKKFFAVLWHVATGYDYSGWSKASLTVYSAEPLFWLAVAAYASFLIAVIFAMTKARKDVLLFVLFSCFAPMILLCALYPTRFEARYVSFAVPPIVIFAAAGFRQLKYGLIGLSPLVVLSLSLTLKTLAMPWDPIHKEDYRAALDYTFRVANENDAVCGLVRPVEYYGPKEKKTHYFRYTTEITFTSRHYARIFLLEPPLYVNPQKDRTRLDSAQRLLARYGYYLTNSIDFGKDGVYIFVHIFELKT